MPKTPYESGPSGTKDTDFSSPADKQSEFSMPRSKDYLKQLSEASDLAQKLFNQLTHIHSLTPEERAQKEHLLAEADQHLQELKNLPTNG